MKSIGLSLCLSIALISCSTELLTYKTYHVAQYVLINRETMAFRTYDRKPEYDEKLYHLATIKKMKKQRNGVVWIDCTTTEKSTIRLILK